MSPYSILVKQRARERRGKGYSFREISERFGISKSTASLWTRDVKLGLRARVRLQRISQDGTKRGREARLASLKHLNEEVRRKVLQELKSIYPVGRVHKKILLAMLFWCEGSKAFSHLRFTNSDPELIQYFLKLFREAFDVNEISFRCCLHLHGYHNEQKQLDYWSKITHIPRSQFIKVYHKPEGRKRIRKNYQGCLSLRYYDSSKAKELHYFYKSIIGA